MAKLIQLTKGSFYEFDDGAIFLTKDKKTGYWVSWFMVRDGNDDGTITDGEIITKKHKITEEKEAVAAIQNFWANWDLEQYQG